MSASLKQVAGAFFGLSVADDTKDLTYRVQGIPQHWKTAQLQESLFNSLQLDPLQAQIQVFSMALDPCKPVSSATQTATIAFSGKPPKHFTRRKDVVIETLDIADGFGGGDAEKKLAKLTIDQKFHGLTPLADPKMGGQSAIDYIAITGLGAHAFGSWKETGGKNMWLRDQLPADVPEARVMTYGFETSMVDRTQAQTVMDIAIQFVGTMRRLRQASKRNGEAPRPIVFLAHSLGGIILKQAMVLMAQDDESNEEDKINFISTYRIFFFAVPNRGMETGHLEAMLDDPAYIDLVSDFRKDSDFLNELHLTFCNLPHFATTEIVSFYETRLSPTPNLEKKMTLLLDQASATHALALDRPSNGVAIHRNHREVCKFTTHDAYYVAVSSWFPDSNKAVADVSTRFAKAPEVEERSVSMWVVLNCAPPQVTSDGGKAQLSDSNASKAKVETGEGSAKEPMIQGSLAMQSDKSRHRQRHPVTHGVLLGPRGLKDAWTSFNDGAKHARLHAPHLKGDGDVLSSASLLFACGITALASLRGNRGDFLIPEEISKLGDTPIVPRGVLVSLGMLQAISEAENDRWQSRGFQGADAQRQRDKSWAEHAMGEPERTVQTPRIDIRAVASACRTALMNESVTTIRRVAEMALDQMLTSAEAAAIMSEAFQNWLSWVKLVGMPPYDYLSLRRSRGRIDAFAKTACIIHAIREADVAGVLRSNIVRK